MRISAYRALARHALRGALTLRTRLSIPRERAICVYDLALSLGLEVRFAAGATLGGLYARRLNTIILPTERPPGRQAFTCAHELGHWYFNHGTRVDALLELDSARESEPEELLANMFAGYLLMPSKAVEAAFSRRKWAQATSTSLQIYVVAGQLGVGYETLAHHLRWSLGALSQDRLNDVLRTSPKDIRRQLLPKHSDSPRIILADADWCDVPVDLSVGDLLIAPGGSRAEGAAVRALGPHDLGVLYLASAPGLARIESDGLGWSAFARVSRRAFIGRAIYRHLEDPDAEPA